MKPLIKKAVLSRAHQESRVFSIGSGREPVSQLSAWLSHTSPLSAHSVTFPLGDVSLNNPVQHSQHKNVLQIKWFNKTEA